MVIALSLCASAIGSVGFISTLLRKAPQGWEDAGGFHYNNPPVATRRAQVRTTAAKPSQFAREVRPALLATAALH